MRVISLICKSRACSNLWSSSHFQVSLIHIYCPLSNSNKYPFSLRVLHLLPHLVVASVCLVFMLLQYTCLFVTSRCSVSVSVVYSQGKDFNPTQGCPLDHHDLIPRCATLFGILTLTFQCKLLGVLPIEHIP